VYGECVCPNHQESCGLLHQGGQDVAVVLVHRGVLLLRERRDSYRNGIARIRGYRALRQRPHPPTEVCEDGQALSSRTGDASVRGLIAVEGDDSGRHVRSVSCRHDVNLTHPLRAERTAQHTS
jgi:hypothetical protein